MTDDERANRNPAVEISSMTGAELTAMPRVAFWELQLFHVYVLQSPKHLVTMNFMGLENGLDPATMMPVVAARFSAPRIELEVLFELQPSGALVTGDGTEIIVREYTGTDV